MRKRGPFIGEGDEGKSSPGAWHEYLGQVELLSEPRVGEGSLGRVGDVLRQGVRLPPPDDQQWPFVLNNFSREVGGGRRGPLIGGFLFLEGQAISPACNTGAAALCDHPVSLRVL